MKNVLTIYTDGGSRGNPGPSAIGGKIFNGSEEINHFSEYLGLATNNQAEYKAMIYALRWVKDHVDNERIEKIQCYSDSQLLVEQLNGRYKVKNDGIIALFNEAKDLIRQLATLIEFQYIPRSQNQEADRLVNKALDAQQ